MDVSIQTKNHNTNMYTAHPFQIACTIFSGIKQGNLIWIWLITSFLYEVQKLIVHYLVIETRCAKKNTQPEICIPFLIRIFSKDLILSLLARMLRWLKLNITNTIYSISEVAIIFLGIMKSTLAKCIHV